jgi:hypothetical protein
VELLLFNWYRETCQKIKCKNIEELLLQNYRQDCAILKNYCRVTTIGDYCSSWRFVPGYYCEEINGGKNTVHTFMLCRNTIGTKQTAENTSMSLPRTNRKELMTKVTAGELFMLQRYLFTDGKKYCRWTVYTLWYFFCHWIKIWRFKSYNALFIHTFLFIWTV